MFFGYSPHSLAEDSASVSLVSCDPEQSLHCRTETVCPQAATEETVGPQSLRQRMEIMKIIVIIIIIKL